MRRRSAAYSAWSAAASREAIRQTSGRLWRATWRRAFLTKALCAALGTDFTTAINAQAIVIGLCFANGLSPVAGSYGWLAGVVFAMLHYGLVTSVPFTHGGFLLYNGGFTGGAGLLPVPSCAGGLFPHKTGTPAAENRKINKFCGKDGAAHVLLRKLPSDL